VPRPLNDHERSVIELMLGAGRLAAADGYRVQLDSTVVTDECECGCGSVFLADGEPLVEGADAGWVEAIGAAGEMVLLHAHAGRLSELEIVPLGDPPHPRLPAAEDLRVVTG
jgi:hypothetical protein